MTFYVSGIRPRLLHLSSIITVCSEYTLTAITLCSVAGIIWLLGRCIDICQFTVIMCARTNAQTRMRVIIFSRITVVLLSGSEITSDLDLSETCTLGAEHCVCMTLRSLCLYDTPFIVFVWHSVHCVCMTLRSLCLYGTPFIVFVWHSVHCVCMTLRSLCLYGTPFIVFV